MSLSAPVNAVCVRKCAKSSSDDEKRLSQGPLADTQLQTCDCDSFGSMKPYGYKGCPVNEGVEADRGCMGWVEYMRGYPDFRAVAAAVSCVLLDDKWLAQW